MMRFSSSKRSRCCKKGSNKTVTAATPLLDRARGEYEKLAQATADARSKLEATTPLLDKARGEYEDLAERVRVLYQPASQ